MSPGQPRTILITGSRNWAHPDRLTETLDQAAQGAERVRLLVGDCPTGADRHALRWARRHGVEHTVFEARWDQMAAKGQPRRAAGPLRNLAMLDALDQAGGQRQVLAFHDDLNRSRGTRQCVKAARRLGYPVTLVSAAGTVTLEEQSGLGELGRAALGYARRGIPVLPLHHPVPAERSGRTCSCRLADCGAVGKHPVGRLVPRGAKDATTSLKQVEAWWVRRPDANVGLATGVVFDVVDLDGPRGARVLREHLDRHGVALGRAPLVRTGAGWQYYLAPTGLGNPSPRGLARVDWRGRGGYVVAPPSRHASGVAYRFHRDLDSGMILPAPEPLRELLVPAREREAARVSLGEGSHGARQHRYGQAALRAEAERVAGTRPGRRNQHLYRASLRLHSYAAGGLLDQTEVKTALLNAARTCGLGAREAQATIASGARVGLAHPRTAPQPPETRRYRWEPAERERER